MAEITRNFEIRFTSDELKQFIIDNFLNEFDSGFSVEDGFVDFEDESGHIVFGFSKNINQDF